MAIEVRDFLRKASRLFEGIR